MYGLLGFVQALEVVFIQVIQFVLELGLIVLEWIFVSQNWSLIAIDQLT